ncbi:unnamed protein product, partial [marine sediment metagenome]
MANPGKFMKIGVVGLAIAAMLIAENISPSLAIADSKTPAKMLFGS